jgi:branched-chain amino acid transport system permease protein
MEYILHLFILIIIYVILAQSLSLTSGFAGMVSLAQAGFYGIGAYTTSILSLHYHLPLYATLPTSMFISGLVALLISTIALRTVEDYFIICTLGIQVILFSLMNNWMDLTNGPLGIRGIPSIEFLRLDYSNKVPFLILSIFIALIIYLSLIFLTRSSFGRVLKALSEDEIYTQSIGKGVYYSKVIAFTITAMLAAIPGVLYAHYISYIDPSSFTVDESIFILSIVIIGGIRNLKGIVVAAAFLVLLPEALRFIGLPSDIAANLRQIIYGMMLVIVILANKEGMLGFFKRERKANI